MAQLVYLDETGSAGKGARSSPYLTLVGAVVDETSVQQLADRMQALALERLGWIPADFEFHGNQLWNGQGPWVGKTPPELLAAFEAVIQLVEDLSISIVHSTIDKPSLTARYGGTADGNAYRLALQFLLEKLDRWGAGQTLRILIADEAKQEQLKAIEMVRDLQRWAVGVVPGRQLVTIIDSMHFVDSAHSPGVQLADMIAFIIHRSRLPGPHHPDVAASVTRMRDLISRNTPTWRAAWP